MSLIPNLFYALIIFLFLFLVVTNGSKSYLIYTPTPCENSSDCARSTCYPFSTPKCIREKCQCI
uniref:Nodule-specific cysteine-rich peptide G43 n=1 Tax=Pisum sativum TaxID=3888 RepID=A0A7T8DV94_PEA|nr:nodule-specific cysteine-rich peptide G43 [Pisum sativum]